MKKRIKMKLTNKKKFQQQAIQQVQADLQPLSVQEAWNQMWDALQADPVWQPKSFCLFVGSDYMGGGKIHSADGLEVSSRTK